MIVPIRCFTCGGVIADKYRYYQDRVRNLKVSRGENLEKVVYLTKNNVDKTAEGEVLDEMGITNMCCRRMMLTCVEIQ
jgi:DNA-directed RNA polymerase subunit N (RpoN/RPB10)